MSEDKKPNKPQAAVLADDGDPTGCCKFTNALGELDCIDGLTQAECAKIPHSIFSPGGSC